jgi:hypothetical protein
MLFPFFCMYLSEFLCIIHLRSRPLADNKYAERITGSILIMRSCLAAFLLTILLVAAVIGVGMFAIGQLRTGLCAGAPLRVMLSMLGGGLAVAGLAGALLAFLNAELLEKSLGAGLIIAISIGLAVIGLGVAGFLTYQDSLASCPRVDQFTELASVCHGVGLKNTTRSVTRPPQSLLTSTSLNQDDLLASVASPDRLVVLGLDGQSIEWTELARREWAPKELTDISLVVCASEPKPVRLETCKYGGGISINRYREEAAVRLVDAQSGQIIVSTTLSADPPACQPLGLQELSRLHAKISIADLKAWVTKVLAGEPAPGVTPSPTLVLPTATITPAPSQTPSPAPTPEIMGTVKVAARVRAGPSTNDATLGGLLKGAKVMILGANNDRTWLKILTPDSQNGWIFAELVKLPLPLEEIPIAP